MASKTRAPRKGPIRRFLARLPAWGKALGGIAAFAVAITTILLGMQTLQVGPWATSSASDLAEMYDGTNPAEACAETASQVDLFAVVAPTGERVADAQLMYSEECNTNWLRVTSLIDSTTVEKTIEREDTDDLDGFSDVTTDETHFTEDLDSHVSFGNQLYAPECVFIEVRITDSAGKELGRLDRQEIC